MHNIPIVRHVSSCEARLTTRHKLFIQAPKPFSPLLSCDVLLIFDAIDCAYRTRRWKDHERCNDRLHSDDIRKLQRNDMTPLCMAVMCFQTSLHMAVAKAQNSDNMSLFTQFDATLMATWP